MEKSFYANRIHYYLISAIVLLTTYYGIQYASGEFNSDKSLSLKFQENFIDRQLILESKSAEVFKIINDTLISDWPALERLLETDHIFAQVFKNDSLIFWNTNQIQNQLSLDLEPNTDTVIKENTGWYLVHYEMKNELKIFLISLIKSEYPFENKFLPSVSNSDFISIDNVQLTHDFTHAQYVIYSKNGSPIVGYNFQKPANASQNLIVLLFFIFIAAYLMLLLWMSLLYQQLEKHFPRKNLLFLFYLVDVFLLRFADFYLNFPATLKQSFLFEPTLDIFNGLNSQGDILITAMLIMVVVYRYSIHVMRFNETSKLFNYLKNFISILATWVLTVGSFYIIYQLTGEFRINPALGVQLSGFESIAALAIILLLNILLYLLIRLINSNMLILQYGFIYGIVALCLFAILAWFYLIDNPVIIFVSLSYILLLMAISGIVRKASNLKFLKYILYLIIIAAANALLLNESIHYTKDKNQIQTANYLAEKSDKNLEQAFSDCMQFMASDSVISLIIENYQDDPEPALNDYIKNKYFKEISGKYDIQLTLCAPGKLLEIQPEEILVGCDVYFEGMISDYGNLTEVTGLYLQSSSPESIYYIGMISNEALPMLVPEMNLYIEFYFTYVPEGLGYPELLVDNKTLSYDLSGYSFAKYRDDKLVYKFGDFGYYTEYSPISEFSLNEFYNYNGFRHLKLVTKSGSILVLSRPSARLSEKMVTFSLLFLLFGLAAALIFIAFYREKVFTFFAQSFRTRLQLFFIGIISITIFVIAIITSYYVESSNRDRLITQLNEKAYSVLIELQHKLGTINTFDEFPSSELEPLLRKFSLVFFSDINVYDPAGKLVASSRPEIFEKGLLSELINPLAFEEIYVDNKLFYTTQEKIGELTYYSSYVPLNLGGNDPIGIVNLPYFARQTEVKKSYNLMIFSFLNLFVIAGIIGTFIALFISKMLTKPLVVLQKSLSEIKIDVKNERIDWEADDEIGMLIREYNHMVDKLEQSTELLKHSERESAWREVARQIAHEIKNPLTPMKLNVQYLEKAYRDGSSASDEKIHAISKSLVQQIDTLDKVAEMFSDFATANVRKLDRVDVLKVIHTAVALFKNYELIDIRVHYDENVYFTKAIEKDLLRVFNNLIKNAVQSLESMTNGKIDIFLSKSDAIIDVLITDNGKGIDDEFKAKIFQPYFTTKSGGTGLGLAIVRNIINEIGGSISFESSSEGTTFKLKLKGLDG